MSVFQLELPFEPAGDQPGAIGALTSGLERRERYQTLLGVTGSGKTVTMASVIARHERPTLVLSPALGGIVIGQEVGRALGVRAIFAERQDGALTLRRGFIIGESDRVLVVEDVLTTGGSTRETMQVAAASGGQVVGAASIVDRSGPSILREPQDRPEHGRGATGSGRAARDLGVPYVSLLDIDLPAYEPDKCPLCAQGLPVIKPGSRPVAT